MPSWAYRFAKLCQEHEFFYILGSGPNFSQTYGFAYLLSYGDAVAALQLHPLCRVLPRPLRGYSGWRFYFLQMGSSECRAMDERALAFLKTHTDTLMVLDARSTVWKPCRRASVPIWTRCCSTP